MTPPTGAHPTSFVIETLQDHYALCSQSGIVTSRSVLDSSVRVAHHSVVSLRNFISALEVRRVELTGHFSGIASAEAFGEGGEVVNDEIIVTFDESLSGVQIK